MAYTFIVEILQKECIIVITEVKYKRLLLSYLIKFRLSILSIYRMFLKTPKNLDFSESFLHHLPLLRLYQSNILKNDDVYLRTRIF